MPGSRAYHRLPSWSFRPDLSSVLLAMLLIVLWLAGGASRPDVLGQPVVRGATVALLIIAVLMGERPVLGHLRPVAWLLAAAIGLALIQQVPLPPSLWPSLPGHADFLPAATLSGQPQPWRPLAIVPGAALNATFALIVPLATFVFMAGLDSRGRRLLPGFLLGCIAASMLVGLLQVSGARFDNPLINETIGYVGGTFANRNHFALYLALGCLAAPVWAVRASRGTRWRYLLAAGLVLLFALVILASGSRAGTVLGALGIALGIAIVAGEVRRSLKRRPTWLAPALAAGAVALLLIFVVASIVADRAVSVDRALAVDIEGDMRSRALPTVLAMVIEYFPFGSGLGGFDPIFRMHEPFALLKPTYFNHAHNDWLEVVLDAGLPGLALLAAAVGWWLWASVGAWRSGKLIPRLGSSMLFLIMLASAFDYPARTPMMMAVVVIAASWLAEVRERQPAQRRGAALPSTGQHL
jgi:O-antigen ligase